jgi:hypothetical protein
MTSRLQGRVNCPLRQTDTQYERMYILSRYRQLRQVYCTDRSAYIGFNHSDQHLLCVVVLTHCSRVHFYARSRVYRVVISVYSKPIGVHDNKISLIAS